MVIQHESVFGLRRPTAVTFPPTESFLPVEIMWVWADEKRTWSSITSQKWKRQFFVTLFHGCHNTVHGSYRMSHYSDSALLCVAPCFDCGIHYDILYFMSCEKQVEEWSLCRCNLAQSEALVVLSIFHVYTGVIFWKGDLGSTKEVDWTEKFNSSAALVIQKLLCPCVFHPVSCMRKSSHVHSGH